MELPSTATKQIDEKKDELQLIAQEILKKVRKICCFGSDNKAEPKKINEDYFNTVNQGLNFVTIAYKTFINNLSPQTDQTLREPHTPSNSLLAANSRLFSPSQLPAAGITPEQKEIMLQLTRLMLIYRSNKGGLPISLEQIMENKKGFAVILKTYLGQAKQSSILTSDESVVKKYLPIALARHLHQFNDQANMNKFNITASLQEKSKLHIERIRDDKLMQNFYSRGIEPTKEKDRAHFFTKTCNDIKGTQIACVNGTALRYGFGNCGLMTDIAFLEAIYRNLPHQITYVRFINSKNKKAEELNALVIGPWPAKGCLVISPWQGNKGKIITWQGTTADTPEIATVNNFDKYLVIFKVSDNEKIAFRKKLIEDDYLNWTKNATRQKNIRFILQCSDELIPEFKAEGLISSAELIAQQTMSSAAAPASNTI